MIVTVSTELEVFLGLFQLVLDCFQVGQFDVIKVAFIFVFVVHLLNIIFVKILLIGHHRRWARAAAA